MRKLSERKEAYRLLLSSPRNQRALQPLSQLRKVVLSQPETKSPRPSLDHKLVDSINSLELPTDVFESFRWTNREYHLTTPSQLDESEFILRRRDLTQLDEIRLNTGARRSQARFFDSVRTIRQYCGSPVREILTLREQTKYKPYSHPHAGRLFRLIRDGQFMDVQRMVFVDRRLLNVQDPVGSTALHLAVKRDDVRLTELLLKLGANVEAQDMAGRTSLYLAARKAHTGLVSVLLRYGASPRTRTIKGDTPMQVVPRGSDTWTLLTRAIDRTIHQTGLVY